MAGMFDDLIPAGKGGMFDDLVPKKSAGYGKAREKIKARESKAIRTPFGGDIQDQVIRNLGIRDEMAGGIGYLAQGAENVLRRATGRNVEITAADRAAAEMDRERELQKEFANDHPAQNALATGMGLIVGGVPGKAATVVRGGTSALKAGAEVAAANAPFALARQEGTLKERLPGAATESALAFGMGSVLTAGGNALARRAAVKRAAPISNARKLAEEGVTLTPGQMAGGIGKRIEDVLMSAPLTGASINARRLEGLEDLNRAGYNRALAPLGKRVGSTDPAGREGVAAVQREISDAYKTALTGVKVAPDQQFASELAAIESTPNLTPSQQETLKTVLGDVQSRFKGAIDGDLWKQIDADLGADIAGVSGSDRLLKGAVQQVRAALKGALERSDPAAANAVKNADEAFANFVRIRQGAGRVGAENGVMTAPQFLSAVQATDRSGSKGAFAGGNALMQDLAEAGKNVLPSKIPDSGTAIRGLVGLGTYGGGALANPGAALSALATDAAGSLLYSRPVINAINAAYRASTPGQVTAALAQLEILAARNPALAPAYREIAEQLGVRPRASSRQQNALAAQQ